MPLELSHSINELSEKLLNKPIIKKIMTNPIYSSLLIVVCMILIVTIIFWKLSNKSIIKPVLKAGFYMFFITSVVLFMQNKVVMDEYSKKHISKEIAEVFGEGEPAIEGFSDSFNIPVDLTAVSIGNENYI